MSNPADAFDRSLDTVASPARDAFAVSPHDLDPLPRLPKALIASAAGTITLRAVDAAADVTLPVAAGQLIPIRASHIRATGTTATIVALA